VGEAGACEETAAVVVLLDVPVGEVVEEELGLLQPEIINATIKINTTAKISFFNIILL